MEPLVRNPGKPGSLVKWLMVTKNLITEQDWEDLELRWAKTYLERGTTIPEGYFSEGIVKKAKRELKQNCR